MDVFLSTISSFPTVIFTVLLIVVLAYCLFTILSGLDIDVTDVDVDLDVDSHTTSSFSGITAFLSAFGLTGIPFSFVIGLLALCTWAICYVLSQCIGWVPGFWVQLLVGIVVMVVSVALGLWLTGVILRPLRPRLMEHKARSNQSLVGLVCEVRSLKVSPTFGQGKVCQGSQEFIIHIRAAEPNQFTKGSKVVLASYQKQDHLYWVEDVAQFEHLN